MGWQWGGGWLSAAGFSDFAGSTLVHAAGGAAALAGAITRLMAGKTDVIQMLNGAIGGLVAITAEPLMPSPLAAILIGAIGGLIAVSYTHLTLPTKVTV